MGAAQGSGAVFPQLPLRAHGRIGAGIRPGAGNVPDDPDEVWHRLRPGQLGRSGKRHAEKGLHRSGAAGFRSCDGVQKERQSFRPVPGSADVSYHRRPGKCHRLRRAHYERPGQKRRQILKFPGNPDFQQAKEPVCPELRQEKQNGLPDSGGGVHGRHCPASVWI